MMNMENLKWIRTFRLYCRTLMHFSRNIQASLYVNDLIFIADGWRCKRFKRCLTYERNCSIGGVFILKGLTDGKRSPKMDRLIRTNSTI